MPITELNILVENKPGQLYKTLKIIADEKIDIWAISCDRMYEDKTNVRVITSDTEKTEKALAKNKMKVTGKEVVVVDISDSPGELASICEIICKGGVNVETVYASLTYIKRRALAIFTFDNNKKAIEILKKSHLTLVTNETLQDNYTSSTYNEQRSIKEYFSTIVSP